MKENKDKGLVREEAPIIEVEERKNYLLIIGIDKYKHCGKLNNARSDAEDFAVLLQDHYFFDIERTIFLLDQEATRINILTTLRDLAQEVDSENNLIIYFSGHGHFDEVLNEAFWIPVDARYNEYVDYISYGEIKTAIKACSAHHIILIVDSCYSGALFVKGRVSTNKNRFDKDPSRWMLASGRNEVVPDGVQGENSPFSDQLLNTLYRYSSEGIRISSLIDKVITATIHNSAQTPIGRPLYDVGDRGGEFIFLPTKTGNRNRKKDLVNESYNRPSLSKLKIWKRNAKAFQTALYILLVTPIIWWLLLPQKKINSEINLVLDRFAFENYKEEPLFYDLTLPQISFQNITYAGVEAERYLISTGKDPNSNELFGSKSELVLEAESGISGILNLSSAIFDKFYLPPAHNISLEQHEAAPGRINIWVQPYDQMNLNLQFSDKLNFSTEHLFVNAGERRWDVSENLSGQWQANEKENGIIEIKYASELSGLISFQVDDSLPRTGNIKIGLLNESFTKSGSEKPINAIRSGEIFLMDHRSKVIDTIKLSSSPSEILKIAHSEPINLSSLAVKTNQIDLSLKGKVDAIYTGTDRILRNPSRLAWLWNYRKIELALLGLGLLGLLYLLSGKELKIFWDIIEKLF